MDSRKNTNSPRDVTDAHLAVPLIISASDCKPSDRYHLESERRCRPIGIAAAINGAVTKRTQNPFLPISWMEAAVDAYECGREGAGYCHVHSREESSGEQFADLESNLRFNEKRSQLAPGLVESQATSRRGLIAKQIDSANAACDIYDPHPTMRDRVRNEMIRCLAIEAKPDCATIFTALETKLGSNEEDSGAAFDTYAESAVKTFRDPQLIAAYYHALRDQMLTRRIIPEYEVTTAGALTTIEGLIRKGLTAPIIHIIVLFGFSARLKMSRGGFDVCMRWVGSMRKIHPGKIVVSVGAVVPPHTSATVRRSMSEPIEDGKHDYLELLDWALHSDTPDLVRVGLEDSPILWGHPVKNRVLVELVRTQVEMLRVPLMHERQVRALFDLPAHQVGEPKSP